MIVARRIEVRGWYAALVALWLLAGLPLVYFIGLGFAGFMPFLFWLALNAVLFAPVMLAPYGLRRVAPEVGP